MTLTLEDAILVIESQTKLIKQQSIEITELEQKLEQREYNKRYTNTKFKKEKITPPFNVKPITYIQEMIKPKEKSKK